MTTFGVLVRESETPPSNNLFLEIMLHTYKILCVYLCSSRESQNRKKTNTLILELIL